MLQVRHVSKTFSHRKQEVRALENVHFTINKGEVFALVGESGSGKSTLAHLMMRLEKPDKGRIYFNEVDIFSCSKGFDYHRMVQMIFQNPEGSLNPRMTVEQLILEPLLINHIPLQGKRSTVHSLMEMVKLPLSLAGQLPRELSGGQKQRVAIARALALKPQLIVADEATSSLDALIEREIIELLKNLHEEMGVSILLITHNLDIVRSFAERVGVMQRGKLIEIQETEKLFADPQEAYTKQLLEATSNYRAQAMKSRQG
ncbi:ABC transporter ATP-binding protein [Halalkalibacterium ligniniphilum]|uniref:ABC transporter ATP-binding protein n=1 Tax=Halalkalibacterium ligniniphilum TaxID=1134413 RepID=UPI00034994A5|nr:dipeptide/oligopeptide/nickel ABC transporter ATP-binding protein [Halalkalibacterium ligniniphilum]